MFNYPNVTRVRSPKSVYNILLGSKCPFGDEITKSQLIATINQFQKKSLHEVTVSIEDMVLTSHMYFESGFRIHLVNYPKLKIPHSYLNTFTNDLAVYILGELSQKRIIIEIDDVFGKDVIMYENNKLVR